MARKPLPGGDRNAWGQVVNEFLDVSHNTDGTIKPAAVQFAVSTEVQTQLDTQLQPAVEDAMASSTTLQGVVTDTVNANTTITSTAADVAILNQQVYDVRSLVSDTTGATDVRAELQAAVNALPAGSVLSVPQGAVLNLTGHVVFQNTIGIVGPGEFKYTAMNGFVPTIGAIQINGDGSYIDGLKVTDVAMAQRGGAVYVQADHVTITNMKVDNFGGGIFQHWQSGEHRGFICTNNIVTNVRGGSAAWKESGGDGIYASGMDVIITDNIVRAKDGEDARCGIVSQSLDNQMPTPVYSYGTQVNGTSHIIANNLITGPFRRAIHTELLTNFVVANNVMYGMSYWGIISWGDRGAGLIANNVIKWTDDGTSIAPGPGLADPTDGTPPGQAGIYLDYPKGVRVIGNTIQVHSAVQYGIFATGHWSIEGRLDVQIDNNTIECLWGTDTPVNGIHVVSLNNDKVSVRNNTFRGGLRRNVYVEGLPGKTDNRAFISGNDCVRQSGSYPVMGFTRINILIVNDNFIKNGSAGVQATDCAASVVKHNTIMDCPTGVYKAGTGTMYLPNNTFINVTTKNVGSSNMTYGPA